MNFITQKATHRRHKRRAVVGNGGGWSGKDITATVRAWRHIRNKQLFTLCPGELEEPSHLMMIWNKRFYGVDLWETEK